MRTAKTLSVAMACAALALCVQREAKACGRPLPQPMPVWVVNHGNIDMDPNIEVWVGQQISLFPPGSPTTCSCGLGLGSTAQPLPPGITVEGVRFTITNTVTHQNVIIPEFSALLADVDATNGWQGGAGANPGSTWFGFSGLVPAFTTLPPLDTNEVYKLWFELDVQPPLLGTLLDVQFGSGKGTPGGSPDFDAPHDPATYGFVSEVIIPEPATLSLLAVGAVIFARKRRTAR
ncbi:MAG: PEP-CTERM sorting domain-containing protein [Phycisphaerales bacterium]|nr:PEP-CTERM sorting domain-containing protein [Phycisphaerales bacterium]